VKQRQRYRRSPHTHTHALTHTPADAHRAIKLAHYRLPDSHHELLEKSIEYKKSPWCARRAKPSPLPPLSFLSFCLSSSFSLFLFLSLLFSLSLSLSFYLSFASLSPTTLPASRRISHAHTRYPCSPLLATKRGRARVYTLAIDGDRRHACTHDGQGRR